MFLVKLYGAVHLFLCTTKWRAIVVKLQALIHLMLEYMKTIYEVPLVSKLISKSMFVNNNISMFTANPDRKSRCLGGKTAMFENIDQ